MAVRNTANIVGYGLTNALTNVFPSPIVSTRAPTDNDTAQIGQVWIDKPGNQVYVLTSVVANVATWVSSAGGGGIFSSLSVSPGPISLEGTTTINTTSTDDTTIGNATGDVGILGSTVDILATQLSLNLTTAGDTSIGNTTGSVDITGGSTTIGAVGTLLLDGSPLNLNVGSTGDTFVGNSTGSLAMIGDSISIASPAVNINVSNAGDTTIGNVTGTVEIASSGSNMTSSATFGLEGSPININTDGTGNTFVGNSTGTVDIAGSTITLDTATLDLNVTTLDLVGNIFINDTGAGETSIGVGGSGNIAIGTSMGTGSVSIGNTTGNVFIGGNLDVISGSNFAVVDGQSLLNGIVTLTGQVNINNSGSASTFIAALGTGSISMGNLTGTTDIVGSELGLSGTTVNVNVTGTGETFIGNSVGSISAIGDSIALATPSLNLNLTGTGNTAIGNTTGTVDITGSVISINEFKFSGGPNFLFGSGSPNGSVTAGHGSFYLNTAGSGVNDRAFINTDGAMAWTAIVTVA